MFHCAGSGFKGKPKKKKKRKTQTPEAKLLYIQLTISFLICQKRTSSTCRLYNNHLKDTQGHAGNHVVASVPIWFFAGKYALENSSMVCRVPL